MEKRLVLLSHPDVGYSQICEQDNNGIAINCIKIKDSDIDKWTRINEKRLNNSLARYYNPPGGK